LNRAIDARQYPVAIFYPRKALLFIQRPAMQARAKRLGGYVGGAILYLNFPILSLCSGLCIQS